MAITNHERVGKALELLKQGLGPFIEREFKATYKSQATDEAMRFIGDDQMLENLPISQWDASALLKLMWVSWNDVFRPTLSQSTRSLISELRDHRNNWAHQQPFSSDDAYRALDSTGRLLTAISASEAAEIEDMKIKLLRLRFDEQVRHEKRKTAGTAIQSQATGNLKPWREVVTPHQDVANGRYQQAEFAADLWQVHLQQGAPEYRDPVEFFRRTYLTESLQHLLTGAIRRLVSGDGDPVVQLQTNFGGGKTHSMLALYHLFSGIPHQELLGIDSIMQKAEATILPPVKRVVLVGNKISPGNPVTKPDGTVVRTFWGELAWQLGGKEAFAKIKLDDQNATCPGDILRELFNDYGPCLILIDEWVAYARQLHQENELPGGSFETQFTFAQVLTESAKLAKNCLLVISLPASNSPQNQGDDAEVGGQKGREALDRLRNVIGRIESSWRPATAEEGFEIVRRRLFEPLMEQNQFIARDTVARQFYEYYRTSSQEFPPECRETEYEKRLKAAYPIHPEIFDRLYTDWSTLLKFQRTRGVLRLMAAVIHSLWEKGDRNPLIMPANIPIDDPRVQFELTRYLTDNWVPVIEKDVDSPNSLPLRVDSDVPNLGKFSACRRVARTIYLGSAPTTSASNRGLEDRRIKLGCVIPGESPAVFGDALRRLSSSATYLYQDGPRYWYSTQPTVTKLAEDRAELLKRNPDAIVQEIAKRLRTDLQKTGNFKRIHTLPQSGQDVADDFEARLVILGPDHPYSKDKENAAIVAAKEIFESRGTAPRLYRNTVVFLAIDQTRLQDLDESIRFYLAWQSILTEKETLDLSPHQVKQAETQKDSASNTVDARLPEAYQWLILPLQNTPQSEVEWQAFKLTGNEPLAVRVSKKISNEEKLLTQLAGTSLRMYLDRIPLWRGDHVTIKQLIEDFSRYLYLPRLKDPSVLIEAIRDGLSLLTWSQDSFAYADSFDEESGRYRGLRSGQLVEISEHSLSGLLVKPSVAKNQSNTQTDTQEIIPPNTPTEITGVGNTPTSQPTVSPSPKPQKRFYASVKLNPTRVGRDAGRIADEVIAHLAGLIDSEVTVTLEIEAKLPSGAPDNVIRTVTENSRTLKFSSHGFEDE